MCQDKNSHPVQKTVSKWRVDSRLSQHEINIKVKINSDGFAIFNMPVCIAGAFHLNIV